MTRALLFRKACALIAADRRGTSRDDGYHDLLSLQCNAAAREMALPRWRELERMHDARRRAVCRI